MFVVVGLGNPGDAYRNNRHNIGFMVVDQLHHHYSGGPWKKAFNSQIAEIQIKDDKILLVKPLTYMNLSGQAVGEILRFYKLLPQNTMVIHDELSLAEGKIRTKIGGGAGGHNGLKSLDQHITPDYTRIRIGIGHPGDKNLVTPYVLGNFSPSELEWVDQAAQKIAKSLPNFIDKGFEGLVQSLAQ